MTQIFNPLLDQVAAKNLQERALRQNGRLKRVCWTCRQEKPVRGGVFPNRQGRGFKVMERFCCADCTERLNARKSK